MHLCACPGPYKLASASGKGGKKHRKYPQSLAEAQRAAAAAEGSSSNKQDETTSGGKEGKGKAKEPTRGAGGVEKLKRSLWNKLILATLRAKGIEWEGYIHALSLKRLKKEVIAQAALQAGVGVGGEDGQKLKALYDKHFKPGEEYEIDEDRCVLLDEDEDEEEEEVYSLCNPDCVKCPQPSGQSSALAS